MDPHVIDGIACAGMDQISTPHKHLTEWDLGEEGALDTLATIWKDPQLRGSTGARHTE